MLNNTTQSIIAIIMGMFIQFFLGANHTFRTVVSVVVTSIFVALYLVHPFVTYFKIPEYLVPPAYALSTVISASILGLLIAHLPSFVRAKLEKVLGMEQGKEKDKNDTKR